MQHLTSKTGSILKRMMGILLSITLVMGMMPDFCFLVGADEGQDEIMTVTVQGIVKSVTEKGEEYVVRDGQVVIETSDGSFKESFELRYVGLNKDIFTIKDVPILDGVEGRTTLTVLSSTGIKPMTIELTQDMDYSEPLAITGVDRESGVGEISTSQLFGESLFPGTLTVTDSEGREISCGDYISDYKLIILNYPEELREGQVLYIHSGNDRGYADAVVTLNEKKSAALNDDNTDSAYIQCVYFNLYAPDGQKAVALVYHDEALVQTEDRTINGYITPTVFFRCPTGQYTFLFVEKSAYQYVGEAGFATLTEAKKTLDGLAENLYTEQTVTTEDDFTGKNTGITYDNFPVPAGFLPASMLLEDIAVTLPQTGSNTLAAGGTCQAAVYLKQPLAAVQEKPVFTITYRDGNGEQKEASTELTETKTNEDRQYAARYDVTAALPEDAVQVEKAAVHFDDVNKEMLLDEPVSAHMEIKMTGSPLKGKEKRLSVTSDTTGKTVYTHDFTTEAFTEGFVWDTAVILPDTYTVTLTGTIGGYQAVYGSVRVIVGTAEKVSAELYANAVEPATITPEIVNEEGLAIGNAVIEWYEDSEGTKLLSTQKQYTIDTEKEVYAKAVPTGAYAVRYDPSVLTKISASDEYSKLILTKAATVTVRGKVVADGKEKQGVKVTVSTLVGGQSSNSSADTAQDGSFTIENILLPMTEEKQLLLTVSGNEINTLTADITDSYAQYTAEKVITAESREGIIEIDNARNAVITNSEGTIIPYRSVDGKLFLKDLSTVQAGETLSIHVSTDSTYGDTTVTLNEKKGGDAKPYAWYYMSRVEFSLNNPYRQKMAVLLYRDGELLEIEENNTSLSKGARTENYSRFLYDGSYTFLFVQQTAFGRLGSEQMQTIADVKAALETIGDNLYLAQDCEIACVEETGSNNRQQLKFDLKLPGGMPKEAAVDMAQSGLYVSEEDEILKVRVTVAPTDREANKALTVNIATNQTISWKDNTVDPSVIAGSLYINGIAVPDEEIGLAGRDELKDDYQVCMSRWNDVYGLDFDGNYQFVIRDVTKFGGWPVTIRYESRRVNTDSVTATATASFSVENTNQSLIGDVSLDSAMFTLNTPSEIFTDSFYCSGSAPKGAVVTISVDGKAVACVQADKRTGRYTAEAALEDPWGERTYTVSAVAALEEKQYDTEECLVKYTSTYPVITRLEVYKKMPVIYKVAKPNSAGAGYAPAASGHSEEVTAASLTNRMTYAAAKYNNTNQSYSGVLWNYGLEPSGYMLYVPQNTECQYIATFDNFDAYEDPSQAVYDVYFCFVCSDGIKKVPAKYDSYISGKKVAGAHYWVTDFITFGNTPYTDYYLEYKVNKPTYDYLKKDMKKIDGLLGESLTGFNFFLPKGEDRINGLRVYKNISDITMDIIKFKQEQSSDDHETYSGSVTMKIDNVEGTVTLPDQTTKQVKESFTLTETAGTTYDDKTASQLAFMWNLRANILTEARKKGIDDLLKEGEDYFDEDQKLFLESFKEDNSTCYETTADQENESYCIETFKRVSVQGGSEIWLYTKMEPDTYTKVYCDTGSGMVITTTYARVFEKGGETHIRYTEGDTTTACDQLQLRWAYILSSITEKITSAGQEGYTTGYMAGSSYNGVYTGWADNPYVPTWRNWDLGTLSRYDNTKLSILKDLSKCAEKNGVDDTTNSAFWDAGVPYTLGGANNLAKEIRYKFGEEAIRKVGEVVDTAFSAPDMIDKGLAETAKDILKDGIKDEFKKNGFNIFAPAEIEPEMEVLTDRLFIVLLKKEMRREPVDWSGFRHTQKTQDLYYRIQKARAERARYGKHYRERKSLYESWVKLFGKDCADKMVHELWPKCNYHFIIDPSGYVYEGVQSNRIEAVTAMVYEVAEDGTRTLWEAQEYDQENPYMTGEDGMYEWMVPQGKWSVTFEKAGYDPYTTGENDGYGAAKAGDTWYMPVSPEQLNVNINLMCSNAPVVESVRTDGKAIFVVFDQYMDTATLTPQTIEVWEAGKQAAISQEDIRYPDAEHNNDILYARTVKLQLPEGTDLSELSVFVHAKVCSYTGKTMEAGYTTGNLKAETIAQAETPVFEPAETEFEDSVQLKLTTQTVGAKIFYTLDGTEPTADSNLFMGNLTISSDTVIKAVAIAPGRDLSETVTQTYTLKKEQPQEQIIYGDVTGDGETDIADALKISRYDAGLTDLSLEELKAGDVTGDGEVDIADALKISRYDAGLITELES